MAKLKVSRSTAQRYSSAPAPATTSGASVAVAVVGWLAVLLLAAGTVFLFLYMNTRKADMLAQQDQARATITADYEQRMAAYDQAETDMNAELDEIEARITQLLLDKRAASDAAREAKRDAAAAKREAEEAQITAATITETIPASTLYVADVPEGEQAMVMAPTDDGPSAFGSPWGESADLRLRLVRLNSEEMMLQERLRNAENQAALDARKLNRHMVRVRATSLKTGSWRDFQVELRNLMADQAANLKVYHIHFRSYGNRWYVTQREEFNLSIAPQTNETVRASRIWNSYYGDWCVLVYDDTGQLLHVETSGPAFRKNGQVLRDVSTFTLLDRDGFEYDTADDIRERILPPKITVQ